MMIGRYCAKSRHIWHSRHRSAKGGCVQLLREVLQSGAWAAEISATMRTLGFRTHILLAVAAAAGVIAALARPWYAAAPPVANEATGVGSIQGPVDRVAAGVESWLSQTSGTAGWDALGVWATVIAGLAAVTALAALACLVPALQGIAREPLRYAALACAGIVVWKLTDSPGANAELELRFGAFVAAGAALVAFSSGSTVASTPLRRRRTPAPVAYTPPPAPPRYESAASAPPPGT
jgi:hypothetical protein